MRCRFLLFVLWWILPCIAPAQTSSVTIDIRNPATNAVVGDVVSVVVGVSSTYEVTSVRAQIEDRAQDLVFNYPVWSTTISLAGLARGDKNLTVVARDVFGNTATAQRTILLDRPPLLRIEEPTLGTVAVKGMLDVRAFATDDSPGRVTMAVIWQYRGAFQTLLTGTNSLIGRVMGSGNLWIGATDQVNQRSWLYRLVHPDPGSNLTEIARFDGPIIDLSAGAVLYHTNADFIDPYWSRFYPVPGGPYLSSTQGVAIIRSQLTASEERFGIPGYIPYRGRLINDDGAIVFLRRDYTDETAVIEWIGDSPMELAPDDTLISVNMRIAGSWGAWPDSQLGAVVLRDFVRRTNVFTGSSADFDVARNGDLVWASDQIYRSRLIDPARPQLGRTTSQLTSAPGNSGPRIDGTNVVYVRHTNSTFVTLLLTPFGEEVLAGEPAGALGPAYALNSGWVAYTKRSPTGIAQIWTRSPEGAHLQRTFFSAGGTLQSLNADGQLTFSSRTDPNLDPALYWSMPGVVQPIRVGTGSPYWTSNQLHVVIGRSVFRVGNGTLKVLPTGSNERRLTFQGVPGSRHVLQASSDLLNWMNVVSFTNETGTFEYTDRAADARRFYRAVQQ